MSGNIFSGFLMADDAVSLDLESDSDDDFASLLDDQQSWMRLPDALLSHDFSLDVVQDDQLVLPEESIVSMDGVSKCWKTLSTASRSLLMEEPDGCTWAICEESVSQLPREIQSALYFFHSLKAHVQDYAKYALPSENISIVRDRKHNKVIRKLLWKRSARHMSLSRNDDTTEMDINSILQQRSSLQDGDIVSEIAPLKIRLGFTGVRYVINGQEEKKTFAILFVTFAKNFDALNYIKDVFLNKPAPNESNYRAKIEAFNEYEMIWKRLVSFVAYHNLGVDESRMHKPENIADDPCGVMGVDSMMNMFLVPFQIYNSIKHSSKSRSGGPVTISNMRIAGFPLLSFHRDDVTRSYVEFMHKNVDQMDKARKHLQKELEKFNVDKKKKDEEDEEAAEEDEVDLVSPGGWPLSKDRNGRFCQWGLPPLPIFLDFDPNFNTDAFDKFKYWLVNIDGANGLPELVKTCLRFYLVSSATSTERVCWEHFLMDRQPANPNLVLRKYYGERANPLRALILPGYLREWWHNFGKDIMKDREGGASVQDVAGKFSRYLKSIVLNHKSTIECNSYQSERILQGAQILDKIEWSSISSVGPSSLLQNILRVRQRMSHCRVHDRYQVVNELFWQTWESLNTSFNMNCSNLSFLVEMMISQVFWMTGGHNQTWAAYFQGIQIKSGNGHYRITTKEGVIEDQRKPNSSGMDWSHGRLTELFQVILDRAGCCDSQQNMQAPSNVTGWTAASIPLQTHATITEGRIDTMPDESMAYRCFIATEVRDMPIGPMIQNFPRNADGLEQVKLNTCDPDKTNKRQARVQVKVNPLQFVALSTNASAKNDSQSEEWRTLSAVIATLVPGSAPSCKRRKLGDFHNRTCNSFGSRQSTPDNIDFVSNLFCYTNIWVSCLGGLINKSAAIPWEINPAVLSYMDWLFFFVKEHVEGLLEKFVRQSFRRMKEGYESRQVAKSIWTQSMSAVAFSENSDQAVRKHLSACMCNAMPASEVPAAAHSFLCRGIHMGATLMAVVCAKHLQVPILEIQDLCAFFNNPTCTTDKEKETSNLIRSWLHDCVLNNRFCFDENDPTMYLSSDADINGMPTNEKLCLMRVKKARVQVDNVFNSIGLRVKEMYGLELNETCHMGPEPSIYGNAINSMVTEWQPDFRQLYSNHVYAHAKHLNKIKLQYPNSGDWLDNEPPPFARIFVKKDNNGEIMSYSLGINAWSLLVLVSLGATTIHPHVVNDISRNLLRQILSFSPAAATPGNTCMIRSFNLLTTKSQRIVLYNDRRPKHFLRPLGDASFVNSGTFAYAKNVGVFMPEDVMHCGFLFPLCKIFSCHLLDLLGRLVQSEYEILSDLHYPVWNAQRGEEGYIFADSRDKTVCLSVGEEGEIFTDLTWQDKLGDSIILPLVVRAGACVMHGEDQMGLVLPLEGKLDNYDPDLHCYHYVLDESMRRLPLSAVDLVRRIIPVGQELWIDLRDTYFNGKKGTIPRTGSSQNYSLVVRLNVPTIAQPPLDKVFITYALHPSCTSASASTTEMHTLMVDIWKVSYKPHHPNYLTHLIY